MGLEGDRLDLFDRLQIGMALVGVVDNLVWRVNAAACQILGRGEAELLRTAWDVLIHPGERAKRPDDASLHAAGCRDGQQDVIRFVRPDGSVVHALAITTLLRDGSDPRPHRLVQFQDITREVTARHHLRLLLENAPVTLFLLDRIGRVEHAGGGRDVDHAGASRPSASEALEALEALGSFDTPRGPDTSKEMTSGGTAFDDVTIRRMARRAARSGKRLSGVIEAAGRRYDIHAVPLSAADGTVTSVAMVTTDVTEREQALAELRVRSAEQAIVAELGERSLHNPDPQPLWRAAAQMIADHLRADAVTVHELPPGHAGPCLATAVGTPPEPGILVTSALATRGPVHADRIPASDRQDSPRQAGPHNQPGFFRDQQDFQDQQGTRNGQGPPQRRDDGQGAPSGGCSGLAIPIGRPDDPTAILTIYRGTPPAASGPPGPASTFPDRPEGPIVPAADATGTSGSDSSSGSFTDREVGFVRTVATVLSAAAIRYQVERDANHRALHDELTGLANRTALFERLGQVLKPGRPDQDQPARGRQKQDGQKQCRQRRTGLLFVDLDGFKGVNDSLGHHIGDRLLCEVATRLRGAVRPGDTVARLSGDEFAVLCEEIQAEATLSTIAERVVTALSEPMILDGCQVSVSASVGVALSGPAIPDPAGLLQAADIAMYGAKHQGRGRYLLFEESMRSTSLDRLTTENDLRNAPGTGDLRLHYQPVVSLGGEIVGAEALLRWQHPERGLLYPEAFLPLAEETGIVVPLDRWALRTACHTAATWAATRAAGPPPACPPRISVNASIRQFTDPGFLPELETLLRTTNADHRYQLCLEITESALRDDDETVTSTLQAVHALGVAIHVDNFGTGHLSLTRLRGLPLDGLKIDRRFIGGLIDDPASYAIAAAGIQLAHALGMTAIAKGVETPEQLAALTDLSCDLVQGDYFARPEPRLPARQTAAAGQP
ncbi:MULTISPECIES: EAL domain-containing protein [Protofrankia]|uniref:sensor domain-containing protein n=1 Tax=Protofrankia TaxID=2994361 RepID=UPI00069A00FB|nr:MULTISPECIES: EAL domain-containing protein [Protofrankia]ONH31841.1 hypothetical protein BL254_22460 [Protofrankia sp. BMG5.30]